MGGYTWLCFQAIGAKPYWRNVEFHQEGKLNVICLKKCYIVRRTVNKYVAPFSYLSQEQHLFAIIVARAQHNLGILVQFFCHLNRNVWNFTLLPCLVWGGSPSKQKRMLTHWSGLLDFFIWSPVCHLADISVSSRRPEKKYSHFDFLIELKFGVTKNIQMYNISQLFFSMKSNTYFCISNSSISMVTLFVMLETLNIAWWVDSCLDVIVCWFK